MLCHNKGVDTKNIKVVPVFKEEKYFHPLLKPYKNYDMFGRDIILILLYIPNISRQYFWTRFI